MSGIMADTLIEAARKKVEECRLDLEKALQSERKGLQDANESHSQPGDNYWKPRYEAQQRLAAAEGLLKALEPT